MRGVVFLILLILFVKLDAQNFVSNPSFEDTISCPTNINQLSKAKFWINPTQCSPDYYNACSTANFSAAGVPSNAWGTQGAHTGVAYAGFYAFSKANPNDSREYIQTQLTSPLANGHKYLVSFFLNLSDGSDYSLSAVGAYFSSSATMGPNCLMLNYIPQIQNKPVNQLTDKVNWMLVEDTLLSNGTEQYLTIGNFNTDNTSDTIYHGFSSGANLSYYYIDDVSVIDVQDLGINEFLKRTLHIYPNPTNGKVYVSGFAVSDKVTAIEIIDITGKLVSKQSPSVLNGVIELNLNLNNGVYFIKVLNEGKQSEVEKVIISK
jgi:OOP family OmpA-OmpF porin